MFMFVIGLSIEEPSLNRTATQPTLVAAKVWASLYPSLKRKCGVFREKLSIQTAVDARGACWDKNTWAVLASLVIIAHVFLPLSGVLYADSG